MEPIGKNLYVPKMTDKALGTMDFYQIFNEIDLSALPRGLWGIREPDADFNGRLRATGEYPMRPVSVPRGRAAAESPRPSRRLPSAPRTCNDATLGSLREALSGSSEPLDLIVMPGAWVPLAPRSPANSHSALAPPPRVSIFPPIPVGAPHKYSLWAGRWPDFCDGLTKDGNVASTLR